MHSLRRRRAAALDPEVIAVIVNEPSGADTNADLHDGRPADPEWPSRNPDVVKIALYFDAVKFAAPMKAPTLVTLARH